MSDDIHGEFGEKSLDELDREILAEVDLEERRQRMIKFLPNAITTCSMFFGFIAIGMAIEGKFFYAVWAIIAAAVCDLADGRVARMTKSASPFGAEYDSLSDLVAFGVAPAIIAYFWALKEFDNIGWAAAFIYLACAAIRLAKFNTLMGEEESRRYFRGLPSPIAAGLIIMMIMMHIEFNPGHYPKGLPTDAAGGHMTLGLLVRGGMLIWLVAVALLMVSNIRFRTMKEVNFRKYGPVFPLVGLAAAIALFMSSPHLTIFGLGATYLAIGLVEGGIIIRRREHDLRDERKRRRKQTRLKRKLAKKQAKLARREAKQKKEDKPPMRLID